MPELTKKTKKKKKNTEAENVPRRIFKIHTPSQFMSEKKVKHFAFGCAAFF